MNNKGFTLIELLISIAILSILMLSFIIIINNTFGLTDEKAYESLQKSIINQSREYIIECDNGLIECKNDYVWVGQGNINKTSFLLGVLKKYSYFTEQDFINPITKENINECMIIYVTKDSYATINVELDDSRCLK